jgi:ceramide glucosyltransferase
MTGLAYAFALLTGLGLAQCLAGWILVARFGARATILPARLPPVTILKPLCGDEPLLEEALASCCCQTYPVFQIVFGVQDKADPALTIAQRLRDRYPRCDITIVVDDTPHGPNRKVANLINMLPSAQHDVLVISDSDLHVMPNYLEQLVAALEVPGTGLVTAVFIGIAARRGWPAWLGATHINHVFLPGVLVARAMGRQDCLGSTVMLRRQVLEAVGGLRPLVTQLAEDNVLGQRVLGLGLMVRLADIVTAVTVPEVSFRALWQHEIRWARTIRGLVPISHAVSTFQHPLFSAVMALVLSGGARWSVALFAFAWVVRAISARGIDCALFPRLGQRAFAAPYWLLPLRDALSVAETIASYWGNEVVWRGHKLTASRGARSSRESFARRNRPISHALPEGDFTRDSKYRGQRRRW